MCKNQNLARTADLMKTFSKLDSINWSIILYEITEVFEDTLPSCRTDSLPRKYNEALLKKKQLTMKEKVSVWKIQNFITERKSKCHSPSLLILTDAFVTTKA